MRLAIALCFSGCLFGLALGCYDQPPISKERPLSCTRANQEGAEEEERCPTGFTCVGDRICAPRTCRTTADCPVGLTCVTTGRGGCQMPSSDAGADASLTPIPIPGDPWVDAGPTADAADAAGGN